jgi:hypothetical protein
VALVVCGGELKLELEGLMKLQDWLITDANDQIGYVDNLKKEGQTSYLTSFSQKFGSLSTSVLAD